MIEAKAWLLLFVEVLRNNIAETKMYIEWTEKDAGKYNSTLKVKVKEPPGCLSGDHNF